MTCLSFEQSFQQVPGYRIPNSQLSTMMGSDCFNSQKAKNANESAKVNEITSNHKISSTYVTLFCISILNGGLIGVPCLALATGDPNRLSYPINSAGEICGKGKQAGKPNLKRNINLHFA